jgi:hypothetical protein
VENAVATGSCTTVFRTTAAVIAMRAMARQAARKLFMGHDRTPLFAAVIDESCDGGGSIFTCSLVVVLKNCPEASYRDVLAPSSGS